MSVMTYLKSHLVNDQDFYKYIERNKKLEHGHDFSFTWYKRYFYKQTYIAPNRSSKNSNLKQSKSFKIHSVACLI